MPTHRESDFGPPPKRNKADAPPAPPTPPPSRQHASAPILPSEPVMTIAPPSLQVIAWSFTITFLGVALFLFGVAAGLTIAGAGRG